MSVEVIDWWERAAQGAKDPWRAADYRAIGVASRALDDTRAGGVSTVTERAFVAYEHACAKAERPCIDCDEPTLNEDRCRDCDQDYVVNTSSCRECGRWIWAEEFGGPIPNQHRGGCLLTYDPEFHPRNDEEIAAVAKMRAQP